MEARYVWHKKKKVNLRLSDGMQDIILSPIPPRDIVLQKNRFQKVVLTVQGSKSQYVTIYFTEIFNLYFICETET